MHGPPLPTAPDPEGEGVLVALRLETGGRPRWVFEPEAEPARDGPPADAWTGLLEAPRSRSTTRADARPFDPEEKERILRVGACLTCHEPTDDEIERIYRGIEESLSRVTSRCVVP